MASHRATHLTRTITRAADARRDSGKMCQLSRLCGREYHWPQGLCYTQHSG